MSGIKRNVWMDDEDTDHDYASDDDREELSRVQQATQSVKRRRVDIRSDDDEDDAAGHSDASDDHLSASSLKQKPLDVQGDRKTDLPNNDKDDKLAFHDDINPASDTSARGDARLLVKTKKPKTKRKSGVIYISRIPPFMKPQTLRSFLSPYGDVGKVFLTPEDHATYMRRKRSGGNKKHSFVDGWVEFLSKKDAKMVAETLNGNIMGGKKGNYYHDDIWNIKYLRGFKWDDLTEQIARETKEHEARLRMEIAKAKRENEAFVRDVEKGKMLDTMEARQKERGKVEDSVGADTSSTKRGKPTLAFKQNVTVTRKSDDHSSVGLQHKGSGALSKVF